MLILTVRTHNLPTHARARNGRLKCDACWAKCRRKDGEVMTSTISQRHVNTLRHCSNNLLACWLIDFGYSSSYLCIQSSLSHRTNQRNPTASTTTMSAFGANTTQPPPQHPATAAGTTGQTAPPTTSGAPSTADTVNDGSGGAQAANGESAYIGP